MLSIHFLIRFSIVAFWQSGCIAYMLIASVIVKSALSVIVPCVYVELLIHFTRVLMRVTGEQLLTVLNTHTQNTQQTHTFSLINDICLNPTEVQDKTGEDILQDFSPPNMYCWMQIYLQKKLKMLLVINDVIMIVCCVWCEREGEEIHL